MEFNSLPDGWALATIEDIAVKGSQRKPAAEEEFIYVDIGSIDREKKCISTPQSLFGNAAPSRARKEISSGDVLVSLTRPNLNAVALIDEKYDGQIASTGFEVIKPIGVDSRYIFALTRSQDFINIISGRVQGALYPAAKSADVKSYQFPLPPQNEQTRIANKLDELLAQVDTIKARVDAIPGILKRFRQSVLAAAVGGRLTEEWRETGCELESPLVELETKKKEMIANGEIKHSKQNEPEPIEGVSALPEAWEWVRLISVSSLITDGKHGNCVDEEFSGYYFLSAKDIRYGELLYDGARQINKVEFDEVHARTNLSGGDICLVNTGATVGKIAIAPDNELTPKTTFQKSVAVIKLIKPYIDEKFIALYLEYENKRLLDSSTGSAVNNLLLGTLKQVLVPIPPTAEQAEISRRADELFAFAALIEKRVKDAKTRIDSLTQSILAKAFRGELVLQDPDDEPASVLLERIRAGRV